MGSRQNLSSSKIQENNKMYNHIFKEIQTDPLYFLCMQNVFFCTCKSTLYKPTLASKLPMLKKKKTKGICLSNSAQKPSNETRLGWRTA
jgi:hypothetical protein